MADTFAAFVAEYWWVLALFGVPALLALAKAGLDVETNRTVAAVYRAALQEARRFQDNGMAWLRSEAGVEFRTRLAAEAYHKLPAKYKALVSQRQWELLVSKAFDEMVALAVRLSA